MLCPEVYHFKARPAVFHSKRLEEYPIKFNFVHSISAILPDVNIPDDFGTDLSSCDYYRVNNLNIDELVKPNFLANFINSGNINVLSINTRIDCDDCCAVTSCGKLILDLNKVTFQTLGLEGKLSRFHKGSKDKYIITVDLKSEALIPGKAYYERVKTCLKKLKMDIIVQWQPSEKEICPSSVAKYFNDIGKRVKLCKIKQSSEILYNMKMPVVSNFDEFSGPVVEQFVEWLGMLMINGNTEEESEYLSSYATPEPSVRIGQIRILRWKGFFNIDKVTELLDEIKTKFGKSLFWKAVYFQGFSDAPVVWGLNEHHFYTNGDNGGVVLMNNCECLLATHKCSNKLYK